MILRSHIYRGPKTGWNPDRLVLRDEKHAVTLVPGDAINQPLPMPPLSPDDQRGIAAGDAEWIYIRGVATYSDVFGKGWKTEFCFDTSMGKLLLGDDRLAMTPGLNKAT